MFPGLTGNHMDLPEANKLKPVICDNLRIKLDPGHIGGWTRVARITASSHEGYTLLRKLRSRPKIDLVVLEVFDDMTRRGEKIV